jgi:two-component system sensor histidine kinase GlrK
MRFRLFRPSSILRLILMGFGLVGVPLMVALVNAALAVDRMASRSQEAVHQAVQATRNSQALVEAIIAMERNARQYQALGDPALLEVYETNHGAFEVSVDTLQKLPLTPPQRKLLQNMARDERDIYRQLAGQGPETGPEPVEADRFAALATQAERFLTQSQEAIHREVSAMRSVAQETQRLLVLQAVALVPVALVLTAIFAALIARPVRQLDQAIRRLGNEELTEPLAIHGPRDLELLGERLDWLRVRLRELEEEKTKFLRHISHELKTPLTAIREGAGLLGEEVVGGLNGQQREITAILQENTVHLQKLIEDLLNVSLATSRSAVMQHGPVELKPLVEKVLMGHKMALLARRLRLETRLQPVQVVGDEEKIRTVVDNLLSNAAKFAPEGGTVVVRLEDVGDAACIEVRDSGSGIPEGDHERVFEAFFQGQHSSNSHIRGTGLGLSIAREYVQAHGGQIEVVAMDRPGACLRVTLPKQKVAE